MTKTQAAAYLAAFIDGEGCVRPDNNRSVSVSNTERDLIDACVECCELLGLKYRIQPIRRKNPKWKNGWELFIHGKDSLQVVRDVVPLRSKRKSALLDEALANYSQLPRPPKEWLEQKYHAEGLSLQECAEAWGAKNSVSAWCWMEFYGIPRRTQAGGQTKYPRPERDWLQARVDEGLKLQDIGDLVGAPLSAVWRWCQHYHIER